MIWVIIGSSIFGSLIGAGVALYILIKREKKIKERIKREEPKLKKIVEDYKKIQKEVKNAKQSRWRQIREDERAYVRESEPKENDSKHRDKGKTKESKRDELSNISFALRD